jgi:YrbI family 3-deoxy-D-manno-octulosonate 8-phosphate phosphatase
MTKSTTVNQSISIDFIDAFIFDFDGVLTNNHVYLSQDGVESVSCSRADGLAFEALRKINKDIYILSTEVNSVVSERAKKLKIEAIQGVNNKVSALESLVEEKNYSFNRILYIGNDLNDYYVMKACGFSVCPADSHPLIKGVADIVLKTSGGNGVARELMEEVLSLDLVKILYN